MDATPEFDFTRLPRADIEAMAEAGAEVIDCIRVLAKTGDNLVGEMLRGQGKFYEWDKMSHSTEPPLTATVATCHKSKKGGVRHD